jgi:hypothetical protein
LKKNTERKTIVLFASFYLLHFHRHIVRKKSHRRRRRFVTVLCFFEIKKNKIGMRERERI